MRTLPTAAMALATSAGRHLLVVASVCGTDLDPQGLARQERVTLVVQVDGKVRDRLEVDASADEATCRELALASENARRFLDGRRVSQVIVRPPRLVNIVTSG